MPESIEAYLQWLFQIVSQSPFVSRSHIELDKRGIRSGLVRGELVFDDGSILYFRELVTVDTAVVRLMYSFHYQSDRQT